MDPLEGSDTDGTRSRQRPAGAPGQDPPAVELVRGIIDDAKTLFQQEIQLAKQEVTEGLTQSAKGGSILAAAGVVGLFMFGFLCATLAWILIALGLPRWAGFGIVTLILLIVAAVLALIGQQQLKKSQVSPVRAQGQFNQAKQRLQSDAQTAATGIQAELRAEAEEAQTEAKKLPDRMRAGARGYAEQARAALRQRSETLQQRQLGGARRVGHAEAAPPPPPAGPGDRPEPPAGV